MSRAQEAPNFLNQRLLVTGASGQLGRFVVDILLEHGASDLVAGTRQPESLRQFAERGASVREVDFDRPETLEAALDGVQRMLLISTDNLAVPGIRVVQHRAAIAAAARAGVTHVVYTSVPNPHPTEESSIPNDHFWTEAALFASEMDWTVLRNAVYSEVVPMLAKEALISGELLSATGEGRRAYVTRADCARVAAAALLTETGKHLYDVTGPETISHDDIADYLSELSGRAIRHSRRSAMVLQEHYLQNGMPPFLAKALAGSDCDASQGLHGMVTPIVEQLTGQKPASLFEVLREGFSGSLRTAP